ncbi:hypothetical protein GQ43DRAFT_482968 [Delitschia confertaspora ATCC 74209]|uniref:Flap structure-specific endonuclease n=1 Tax=Delitschia confertaspora ATCC 74209 TaxID=1513339 RepID=A0A9P4MQD1_9PLEO|nr:hypothetical protein GQ43DRAFT_482968 [Delitschia confertaspora ATCC 74209]
MGIHGVYKEIGPGERIALSKFAVEKYEATGRPLRIAIDVSIWLFQIQASKGGTNPALRTFYYRLLRMISLNINPIFVFDGPNKPPFKRNKRTGPNVASIPEFLAKQLLKQFGFPIHLAPGEAEAECALLQREGIVDAVLSEDVDTLMFGSGITLRNWSPESKGGKTPTHVNVYDAVKTKNGASGLDREGMILVALMSGGDYVPEGIPGCGPKTACEAARAGFGRDLCALARNDTAGLSAWRERLQHELKTNQSKLFKRKHGALAIPEDFPRKDILGYYTHPVVSSKAALDRLRDSIKWDQDLDFPGLREFTQDAFDWTKLGGAKHFIRNLAPALLVRKLRMRGDRDPVSDDPDIIEQDEGKLVKGIHGKRNHAITDNTTEIRISYTPIELVNIDLAKEEPDDELPEPDSEEDSPEVDDVDSGAPKKRAPTLYDPTKPDRVWVLETYVKVGVPLTIEDWEAGGRKPKKAVAAKKPAKPAAAKTSRRANTIGGMPKGALDMYAKVTKPGIRAPASSKLQNEDLFPTTLSQDTGLPSTFRGQPAPSQPAKQSNKPTVIDLLSSSPAKPPAALFTKPVADKRSSPVAEEQPSGVTKRTRQGLARRSQTMPVGSSSVSERPCTPPPPCSVTIDTLDLVSSPAHLPKKPKTTGRSNATAAGQQKIHQTSVVASPGKRQATLGETWARMTPSPLKPRAAAPTTTDSIALPAPIKLQSTVEEIETLDLTSSSPPTMPQPLPQTMTATRRTTSKTTTRPRPPLRSISSNFSQSSTSTTNSTSSRRRSARLCKSSTSPDINNLSLSPVSCLQKSPRINKTDITHPLPSPGLPDLNLTSFGRLPPAASAPTTSHMAPPPSPSPLRRSPRNHTSNFLDQAYRLTTRTTVATTSKSKTTAIPTTTKLPSPPRTLLRKTPPTAKKKRAIALRKSLAGAWEYVDEESPQRMVSNVPKRTQTEKERRRWRESEIEVLDMVD